MAEDKKPADEEAVREWVAAHQERRKLAVDMTWGDQEKALNALEASLGVKRYVMAASVDPESTIVEFIDVEDLLAAIRGALEGEG